MTSRRVIRYYCDYCHKGMFRKPDMQRHEDDCIKNPNRAYCHLCGVTNPGLQKYVELLKSNEPSTDTLDRLRDLCDQCPLCMFAAIVQAGQTADYGYHNGGNTMMFDYKAERAEFESELRHFHTMEHCEEDFT